MRGTMWTPAELAWLTANRTTRTPAQIANDLGRTRVAVYYQIAWLKLRAGKRRARGWSAADKEQLLRLINRYRLPTIAKITGRTIAALRQRLLIMGVKPSLMSQDKTLIRVAKETGYDPRMLHRAKVALGQKWGRESQSRRASYWISPTQVRRLCEYLRYE